MIKVKKNQENPESTEVLAESILTIAEGFERLLSTRLNEKAIVALLQSMPGMNGIGKREIYLILENLKRLKGWYIKR